MHHSGPNPGLRQYCRMLIKILSVPWRLHRSKPSLSTIPMKKALCNTAGSFFARRERSFGMVRRVPKRFLGEMEEFPENVPKRLVREYKKVAREHSGQGGYQCKLARKLGINIKYVSDLLSRGIEPTDRTEKGQRARIALFLPVKRKVARLKSLQEIPGFMKQWGKIPKEERRKVIQQYLDWRNRDGNKKDAT